MKAHGVEEGYGFFLTRCGFAFASTIVNASFGRKSMISIFLSPLNIAAPCTDNNNTYIHTSYSRHWSSVGMPSCRLLRGSTVK